MYYAYIKLMNINVYRNNLKTISIALNVLRKNLKNTIFTNDLRNDLPSLMINLNDNYQKKLKTFSITIYVLRTNLKNTIFINDLHSYLTNIMKA